MVQITLTEVYLIAMILIFAVPFLIWRLFRTEYYAPLVVVQIICGILLGPGILGALFSGLLRLCLSARGHRRPEWRRLVGGHDICLDRRN